MTMAYVHYKFVIGWLPVSSVIQHHSLVTMYKQYRCNHCLLLNLQIKFRLQSSYHIRTSASFANIFQYNLFFSKKFFRSKVANRWNNLVITLISSLATMFSFELIIYLIACIILLCCLLNQARAGLVS